MKHLPLRLVLVFTLGLWLIQPLRSHCWWRGLGAYYEEYGRYIVTCITAYYINTPSITPDVFQCGAQFYIHFVQSTFNIQTWKQGFFIFMFVELWFKPKISSIKAEFQILAWKMKSCRLWSDQLKYMHVLEVLGGRFRIFSIFSRFWFINHFHHCCSCWKSQYSGTVKPDWNDYPWCQEKVAIPHSQMLTC